MRRFDELWEYLSEEAGEGDDYKHYMFTKLEGSLWLREAFL